MVLSNFNGGGVGFGFGVGCGFGVGWGFGGPFPGPSPGGDASCTGLPFYSSCIWASSVPLDIFGLGAGGGCGVGLGLGWGFGAAYGSRYYSPGLTFQGVEFESKSSERKDSQNMSKKN